MIAELTGYRAIGSAFLLSLLASCSSADWLFSSTSTSQLTSLILHPDLQSYVQKVICYISHNEHEKAREVH